MKKHDIGSVISAIALGIMIGLFGSLALAAVLQHRHSAAATVAAQLRPEDREILRATGWLKFVEDSVDEIEYFPYETIAFDTQVEAYGVATTDNGRKALIALGDKPELQVLKIIVHEATHLAPWNKYGWKAGDTAAYAAEAKFEHDFWNKYYFPGGCTNHLIVHAVGVNFPVCAK